jgi:hypothetical protein
MIDIFTSEDMENISLCIFQYLTLSTILQIFVLRAKNKNHFWLKNGYFYRRNTNISTKFTNFTGLYFPHFTTFCYQTL